MSVLRALLYRKSKVLVQALLLSVLAAFFVSGGSTGRW